MKIDTKMKIKHLVILLLGIALYACSSNKKLDIERITVDYYHTFNEREDFDKFLSFYSDDIVLEDIINGDRIIGKPALSQFLIGKTLISSLWIQTI